MVRFVADTHALVWRLTAPRRLGKGALRAFDAADSGRSLCVVPAIVFVELALLKERRRVGVSAADVLRAIQRRPGYAVLALDAEQALEFAAHQGIKDPMDRLVFAAARVAEAKLLSSDGVFDGRGIERVWD